MVIIRTTYCNLEAFCSRILLALKGRIFNTSFITSNSFSDGPFFRNHPPPFRESLGRLIQVMWLHDHTVYFDRVAGSNICHRNIHSAEIFYILRKTGNTFTINTESQWKHEISYYNADSVLRTQEIMQIKREVSHPCCFYEYVRCTWSPFSSAKLHLALYTSTEECNRYNNFVI